jgi:hypothetical protein
VKRYYEEYNGTASNMSEDKNGDWVDVDEAYASRMDPITASHLTLAWVGMALSLADDGYLEVEVYRRTANGKFTRRVSVHDSIVWEYRERGTP